MNGSKGSNVPSSRSKEKVASPIDQLKAQIEQSKNKLNYLKNTQNVELLERVRNLEKEIQRLSIVNVQEDSLEANILLLRQFQAGQLGKSSFIQGSSYINKQNLNNSIMKLSFVKQAQQLPHLGNSQLVTQELSTIEQLDLLKNLTTKNYPQNSQKFNKNHDKSKIPHDQLSLFAQKQFLPNQEITSISQKLLPTVMESQTYPIFNRYLTSKSSLITKLIQLNPEKRNNNSLLVSHQRVMLKEHLDMTRRIVQDLGKKCEELENQIDKDFVMVKNKWEESERELRKLANIKEKQQ